MLRVAATPVQPSGSHPPKHEINGGCEVLPSHTLCFHVAGPVGHTRISWELMYIYIYTCINEQGELSVQKQEHLDLDVDHGRHVLERKQKKCLTHKYAANHDFMLLYKLG